MLSVIVLLQVDMTVFKVKKQLYGKRFPLGNIEKDWAGSDYVLGKEPK
jgi:hypothetical protein